MTVWELEWVLLEKFGSFGKTGFNLLGDLCATYLPDGCVKNLLVNAVIGGVVVFLPQILILFFFILLMEESGHLSRAAFLLDRTMGSVGLSGRSFLPLLSGYACAVPAIMAARIVGNQRDRRATIAIAPLLTCGARLPVFQAGQYCHFRKMLIRILQVHFGKVVMVESLRVDYTHSHDAEGAAQRPFQS